MNDLDLVPAGDPLNHDHPMASIYIYIYIYRFECHGLSEGKGSRTAGLGFDDVVIDNAFAGRRQRPPTRLWRAKYYPCAPSRSRSSSFLFKFGPKDFVPNIFGICSGKHVDGSPHVVPASRISGRRTGTVRYVWRVTARLRKRRTLARRR